MKEFSKHQQPVLRRARISALADMLLGLFVAIRKPVVHLYCASALQSVLLNLLILGVREISEKIMASQSNRDALIVGLLSGSILTLVSTGVLYYIFVTPSKAPKHKSKFNNRAHGIVDGIDGLIGNTPLMRIRSLSEATGCTILVSVQWFTQKRGYFC